MRELFACPHSAYGFHPAPLTNIRHVDQAVGSANWFTLHGHHPPLTVWTFCVRLSATKAHIVTG